jgi:hypothetical protein
VYEICITLRYPKGRDHHETLTTGDPLDVGSEFNRYGHVWRVVGTISPRSRYDEQKTRLVCELADLRVAA